MAKNKPAQTRKKAKTCKPTGKRFKRVSDMLKSIGNAKALETSLKKA